MLRNFFLPAVVDETEVIKRINNPEIRRKLIEQSGALEGSKGSLLQPSGCFYKTAILAVVSASDGRKIKEYELESLPVWDGTVAANNRLYIATKNVRIL